MSEYLKSSDYINAYLLSRDRKEIKGKSRIKDMKRLSEICLPSDNEVTFEIKGIVGKLGWPGATVTIKTVVPLRCERCSQPMDYSIDRQVTFRFARSEQEADALPIEEDDDVEVIVGSEKLNVMEWLEEELILSLPIVPLHDQCDGPLPDTTTEDLPKKESPFAKLRELQGLRKK